MASSIDDLFKKPTAPTAGNKRKLEPPPRNLDDIRKAAKTSINGDAKGKHHATVEDEAQAEEDEDVEAGPELPPEDDDDAEAGPEPEDEEGARFFGAGTNKHTNDVLDYMESREEEFVEPEKIDNAWLRRTILSFERKINKNTELRSKFADDPMKFMESEGELDGEIKGLSILTEHPELYPELVRLNSVNSLVQLLLHENTDIAINAIQIMAELTDSDVAATDDQWTAVADALLEAEVIDLLLSVMGSLNEDIEDDKAGIYHSMELLENLVGNAATLTKIFYDKKLDKLLKYLLDRVQKPEKPVSRNKQYAGELLSIMASTGTVEAPGGTYAQGGLLALNAMDTLLQLLAPYRKNDPSRETDEEQLAEDSFDTIDCLVDTEYGKTKFVEAEGIELALIMMREGGKFTKSHSLRLLSHALSGSSSSSIVICEHFVEAAGLKPLFKTFTSIVEKKDREGFEHVLSIMASLLRCLPGESAARIRTLAKFTEKDFEKVKKLVRLRDEYLKRLAPVTKQIEAERQDIRDRVGLEEKEIDWITRRLSAGLDSLQTISVILAWLYAEDAAAAKQIKASMDDIADGFNGLRATLLEQLRDIGDGTEEEKNTRDMLQTLIDCL